jgi:hypothetical protein
MKSRKTIEYILGILVLALFAGSLVAGYYGDNHWSIGLLLLGFIVWLFQRIYIFAYLKL